MIHQIHPADVKAKLDAGETLVLIDVRNENEHAYCHLPGSVFIPLPELPGRVNEIDVPDGTLVVVYCHHGIRSLSGAAILQNAGLGNVMSMAGGIDAWSLVVDAGVPRY